MAEGRPPEKEIKMTDTDEETTRVLRCDECESRVERVLFDHDGNVGQGWACDCTDWADSQRHRGIYRPWESDLPDNWVRT